MKTTLLRSALACGTCTLALVASSPAAAQSNAGRNGAKFLSIGVGAREAALGGAVTAGTGGDAINAFWNPAGTALASGQKLSASLDYGQWFADLRHASAAVGYNLGRNGTVTLGVQTFGLSGIAANRQNGYADPFLQTLVTDNNTSETYDYLDLSASATYARSFGNRLSLGATAKVVNESIDESASAVAFDFGSLYNVGPMNWQLAARLSNLGTPIQFYNQANPLPLTFSIGSSFYPVNTEQARVMLAADALKIQDGRQRVNGGVEVSLYDLLFLRAGYKFGFANGAENDSTTIRQATRYSAENFSVGGGLQYRVSGYDLALDYAYTNMEFVNDVHRITLRLRR